MEKYKYRAINSRGRPSKGVMSAANEADLHAQLQKTGLELIDCKPLVKRGGLFAGGRLFKSVKVRELVQFFMHMDQMQSAGIPLLSALADVRDTTDNHYFRDIMSEVHRDVSEGNSLSEALSRHPKVFSNIYVSLIAAGEEGGDMLASYRLLVNYLKWRDKMEAMVRKATRYPLILLLVVVATVTIMMTMVVPQIVGFIETLDQELPWPTVSLIATSEFFINYWWVVLTVPVLVFILFRALRNMSDSLAFKLDAMVLKMPLFGEMIRKINISRFCRTFGALYSSGIDVIRSLKSARATVENVALADALENVQVAIQEGSPMSQAFNASGEFPSMVVRMIKVGEESGNLTEVLDQVSEFYTADVDEEAQKLIAMVEPSLTMVLGGIILWIAIGVFGPIYSSFETIDF